MYRKLKTFLETDTYFYSAIIILVAVISFFLGQWSATEQAPVYTPTSITISPPTAIPTTTVASASEAVDGQYVASKNGSKYHLLWCPGAKQMKEENKIFFASEDAAQAAGYTPAANCKGL